MHALPSRFWFSIFPLGNTPDAWAPRAPAFWATAAASLKAILPFFSHLCIHFLCCVWNPLATRPSPLCPAGASAEAHSIPWGWRENAQCNATPVGQPAPGRSGGWRPAFRSPVGVRAPRPAHCCRPGRGAPALRKPECSLSSPRTPFFSVRLESYQTSSGGQTARSCFQLRRGGEEREVLELRAWSKTGREPTPSLFLKGVSESRSGPESQRTGSHLPLKVGFIQSEHRYWAPAVCLAPV